MTEFDPEKQVVISKEYLANLERDADELSALHAGGVDNWEWYSASLNDAGFWDEEDS